MTRSADRIERSGWRLDVELPDALKDQSDELIRRVIAVTDEGAVVPWTESNQELDTWFRRDAPATNHRAADGGRLQRSTAMALRTRSAERARADCHATRGGDRAVAHTDRGRLRSGA